MEIFGLGIIVGLIVGVVVIVCVRACFRGEYINNEDRCNNNENYDSDEYYEWCEDEYRKGR